MPVTPIANKLIEKVVVRLDERDWPLVINFNMFCELKQMTGMNVLSLSESPWKNPDPVFVRAMLYLALREQGADYTLEQTGKLINFQNLNSILLGIFQAWTASMPEKEEDESGEASAAISA